MKTQKLLISIHFHHSVYAILLLIPVFLFLAGCSSESTEKTTTPMIDSEDSNKNSKTEKVLNSDSDKKKTQTNKSIKKAPPEEKNETVEIKIDEAKVLFEKLFTERIDGNGSENFHQASEKFMKLSPELIIPQLIIELQSEQQIRRELASTFLSQLALDAKGAEEVLLKALKDESQFVRINAASTLSVLNSHIEETVSTLLDLLSDNDSQVHMIAIIALRNVAEQAESAIPILIKLLKDSEADTKKEILNTLLVMKKLDKKNLKIVQQLVDSESETQEIRDSVKKLIEKQN